MHFLVGFRITSMDSKKKKGGLTLEDKLPFSYELCHLFLHLPSLKLFVQQDLKTCEAPVALAVLLVCLPNKHRKNTVSIIKIIKTVTWWHSG